MYYANQFLTNVGYTKTDRTVVSGNSISFQSKSLLIYHIVYKIHVGFY